MNIKNLFVFSLILLVLVNGITSDIRNGE